jgi:hypothetical protein
MSVVCEWLQSCSLPTYSQLRDFVCKTLAAALLQYYWRKQATRLNCYKYINVNQTCPVQMLGKCQFSN